MSLEINSDTTQWYECHCDLGQVKVGVVVGESVMAGLSGPLKVMRQATLLSEVELVLQALEIWQGIDLDLQPSLHTPVENQIEPPEKEWVDKIVHVTFTHKETPDYYPVRFELSASKLAQLKPIDAELTRLLDLSWSSLTASLVVDEVKVSREEQQILKPGAICLLPQSFEPSWQARLVLPGAVKSAFVGRLEMASNTFSITAPAESSPAVVSQTLSIRLQQDITLTTDKLLGDAHSTATPLSLDLNTTPLAADIYQADILIGSGTIGPIGKGFALYIHTMATNVMLEIA